MSGARCSGTINDEYGHQMAVTDIERLLLTVAQLQARIDSLESKIGGQQFGSDLAPGVGGEDSKDAESIWTVPIDPAFLTASYDYAPLIYYDSVPEFRLSKAMVVNTVYLDSRVGSTNYLQNDGVNSPRLLLTYGDYELYAKPDKITLEDSSGSGADVVMDPSSTGGFEHDVTVAGTEYTSSFGYGTLLMEYTSNRRFRVSMTALSTNQSIEVREVRYTDWSGTNRKRMFLCTDTY